MAKLRKGSPEAKAHMARIRGMRGNRPRYKQVGSKLRRTSRQGEDAGPTTRRVGKKRVARRDIQNRFAKSVRKRKARRIRGHSWRAARKVPIRGNPIRSGFRSVINRAAKSGVKRVKRQAGKIASRILRVKSNPIMAGYAVCTRKDGKLWFLAKGNPPRITDKFGDARGFVKYGDAIKAAHALYSHFPQIKQWFLHQG